MNPTTTASALDELSLPPPPAAHAVQWLRALGALRQLLANPQQTEKAFEVFIALNGGDEERGFQRLVARPDGRRLLAQRPSLLIPLSDRDALARLPDGSFGRAYLAYLDRNGFDPSGLVKLSTQMVEHAKSIGEELPVLDPAREWARVRSLLMHDLWHVLTDYGTDGLGEAALLAFSYAQLPERANRLLTVGAAARAALSFGPGILRYLHQAWRRGRRAAWLPALPYEELLAQPLDAVRALASIAPAAVAHPGGILRADI